MANKKWSKKKINRTIQIILIIIIILLLLQNIFLIIRKRNNKDVYNVIDISSFKCLQNDTMVDCLKDDSNSKCLVPNFVGKSKKDVMKWFRSISNNVDIEIKYVENEDYKDGIILEQSVVGVKVKDLLDNKTKLVITIVNNGSLVDCIKNSNSSKCILPNFINKNKSAVDKWLDEISTYVNVKYVYVDSNKDAGTIIDQSIDGGASVKDILNNNETIVIYISNGKKASNNSNNNNSNSNSNNNDDNNNQSTDLDDDEELDDEFYVQDDESIRWADTSNINIFDDSINISKVHGKIAPESTGTYRFDLKNGTRFNLKYNISFIEENNDNMNIKFKLKKGNTYLIDNYVSSANLSVNNMSLNSKDSETYYLEWKWVGDDDSNDTAIGNKARDTDVSYSLKIKVEAESE